MVNLRFIKHDHFLLIKDIVIAIFGGFVGAIIGVLFLNPKVMKIAFFDILAFSVLIFFIVLILQQITKEK